MGLGEPFVAGLLAILNEETAELFDYLEQTVALLLDQDFAQEHT